MEDLGKILIVDDEGSVRRLLSVALESVGYSTIAAETGDEAISLATKEKPVLILMDVVMPGMSGFEACSELKNDPRTRWIPVIIISALDREVDRELGRRAGADGHITKPIRLSALMGVVKAQLEKSRRNRFSRRLNIGFEEVVGRKILFEFDPATDYEAVVEDFAKEAGENGLHVVVLNFSDLALFKNRSFEVVDMRGSGQTLPALTALLDQDPRNPLGLIVFTLTDLLLTRGFDHTYGFVRDMVSMLNRPWITALFLLAPKAHEEREIIGLRTLFKTQMRYEDGAVSLMKR